ncbi:MAG: DUF1080 domain-containing protein, partial [Cyclobacteriaceae bacterium]|nr:DUF1080 domain-containing protein [Cyclobacteriaceae bacterium]
ALGLMPGCTEKQITQEENWIQLFNGHDLTGWTIKISGHEAGENFKNTFVVADSILTVNYDEYEEWNNEFAHLFYEKPFSHYRLRIEYRFLGEQVPGAQTWARRNSGVMLHSQSAASMEKNQNFPVSVEMQFLARTETRDWTTCNLASPGTHVVVADTLYTDHMYYSASESFDMDEWVSVEAIVLGDSVIHYLVEGDTVLTYNQPQIGGWELDEETGWVADKTWVKQMQGTLLKEGYIALQAESHPVQFRKVELLDLSKASY